MNKQIKALGPFYHPKGENSVKVFLTVDRHLPGISKPFPLKNFLGTQGSDPAFVAFV